MIEKQNIKRVIYLFVYVWVLLISNEMYCAATATVTGIVSDPDSLIAANPEPIVITPSGATMYVGDYFANNVVIVDPTTNIATGPSLISVAFLIRSIALQLRQMVRLPMQPIAPWRTTVTIIDLTNNTATVNVTDPGNIINEPNGLAITPDGTTLYVANSNSIGIIDVATNTVTGTVSDTHGTLGAPFFTAITPNGLKGYEANLTGNTISIIDIGTNSIPGIVTDTNSTINNPSCIVITPYGSTAYVSNEGNSTISIIDVATDTVTGIVSDPNSLLNGLFSIGMSPDGSTILSPAESNNTVCIVDVATNTVTGLVSDLNNTFDYPIVATFTADGKTAYVSNFFGNTVSIIALTYPIDNTLTILPPTDLTGCKTKNIFLTQIDLINIITWSAPATGNTPVSYIIYRDDRHRNPQLCQQVTLCYF